MEAQDFPAASEALKRALAIKPDYLNAELAQVALESRQQNYDKAMAIARRIQKQHEKIPAGYVAEGDLLMKQRNPALAAKAYDQAFAIGKTPPLLVKLHTALSQAGKGKEATPRLLQWLKEHPTDDSVRMYLAQVYVADQQVKPAIEQYQTILKQNPKHVPALNNLATTLQQERDPQAVEYAEKAYQLAADNPAILDTLGWILVEQGNAARGLPLLQKAVSLAPGAPEVRYHLAYGLVKSGEKAKARKELEQLLGTGKSFSDIDEARTLLKQIQ
jgi:putative PEP-CTERM system TPR-repeat lipoprotein